MSTMVTPDLLPEYLLARVKDCQGCEADRRPRMFLCTYHEGFWDGYDQGANMADQGRAETHYFGDGCTPEHECPADHSNWIKADMCGTCGLVYETRAGCGLDSPPSDTSLSSGMAFYVSPAIGPERNA